MSSARVPQAGGEGGSPSRIPSGIVVNCVREKGEVEEELVEDPGRMFLCCIGT